MKRALAYLACCLIFSAIAALSLWQVNINKGPNVRDRTYWIYRFDDRSIKQLSRTTRLPLLITLFKVQAVQMPDHTGHSDAALTPWLCERKVELVVLDVRIAIYVTLKQHVNTEGQLEESNFHSRHGRSDFLLRDDVPRTWRWLASQRHKESLIPWPCIQRPTSLELGEIKTPMTCALLAWILQKAPEYTADTAAR